MARMSRVTLLLPAILCALVVIGSTLAPGAQASVTGRSPVWQRVWTPPASRQLSLAPLLTRSASGDLFAASLEYVPATGAYDWVLVRFTANGARKWVRRVKDAPQFGSLVAIAADDVGGVVVAGLVTGAGGEDWLLVKYSRSGRLQWKHRYAGGAGLNDRVTDVTLGPSGSFYVAGFMERPGTEQDCALMRISSRGRRLWTRYLDGAAHGSDRWVSVATDAKGRAYVTGHDYAPLRADDVLVARYSTGGHLDWLRSWGDAVVLRHDRGEDIAVQGSRVAVAGLTTAGDGAWTLRGLALSFTTGGKLLWAATRPNDSPSLNAEFSLVGVDTKGRVTAAGIATTWAGLPTPVRWFSVPYGATGGEGQAQRLWGDLEPYNQPLALATRPSGRVYESGLVNFSATGQDALIVSLRPGGSVVWTSRVAGPSTTNDVGGGLAVTSRAVYVAANAGSALRLLKYRP